MLLKILVYGCIILKNLLRGYVFMKIMTFNTQHCRNYLEDKIDYEIMAKAIRDVGADIVGLNEMRGSGDAADYDDQTGKLSQLTGLSHSFFAPAIYVKGSNPYGNSFLSAIPIRSKEKIMIPDPEAKKGTESYETRCILKVVLENGLSVLVTHFGLNDDEQQNAVETVVEHLEKEKCVLMGDFNVKPDNKLLDPIRERMKDTADLFGKTLFSFPSDKPNRKIDYIFVSPDIEIVSADIPAIVASDHRPHICEIKF